MISTRDKIPALPDEACGWISFWRGKVAEIVAGLTPPAQTSGLGSGEHDANRQDAQSGGQRGRLKASSGDLHHGTLPVCSAK
ncbi:MAG: hypothetical protein JO004_10005 [Methylobacteriaceae bacterium]|nr:hypothetical protein [Methylobacteriaceae bacterium]